MANKKFESDIIVNGAIAKVGGLATQFLKANGTIDANTYEIAFTKNTAFNKNFGTTNTTVAEGNDFRILNGQTAFTWGNHAGLYSLAAHTHTFASLTTKPTTLAGYGITDALLASAYTASDVLTKIKTVDGTGSGLDADLLDGLDSTAFARTANSAGHTFNNTAIYSVPAAMPESWFKVFSGGGPISIVYLELSGSYDNTNQIEHVVVTLAGYSMNHHITSTTSNYNGGALLEVKTNEVASSTTEIWVRYTASTAAGSISVKSSHTIPTLAPGTPVFGGAGAVSVIYGVNRGTNSMLITRGIQIAGNNVYHAGNFTNLNQLATRNFSDLQTKPTTIGGYGITDFNSLGDTRWSLASHVHGNISGSGTIGVTSGLPIITGAGGILQAGSFGTTAGTFAQGNDARFSDARNTIGGVLGSIPYQSALNTTAMLAPGTANYFLKSNGNAAPSWQLLDMSYLPDSAFKKSVRVATTVDLAPSTFAAGIMTGPIGVLTIDSIAVVLNDRVLLKDQTSTLQNGIYYVSTVGTAGIAWVLTRVPGANTSSEIGGAVVNVDSGVTNGGFLFDTDFKITDTIDSSPIIWSRIVDTGLASTVVGSTLGTAAIGTSLSYARADHVHPLQTTITGNSGSATILQNARTINGVSFNGSANITITAAASDVSAWAKAAVKPSYTFAEITSKPTTLSGYGITDTPWTGYLPLGGGTTTGKVTMYSSDITGTYGTRAIELREVGLVTTAQTGSAYAPSIGFHWGGVNQTQIAMLSTGSLVIRSDAGTGNAIYHAGNLTNLNQLTNGPGYTTNVGTVTSVVSSGGYGGLTLTGTNAAASTVVLGGTPTGTWPISISGLAGSAAYLPTAYVGGVQVNPQTYFGSGTGLRAAMTGAAGVWSDTLWINGYSGADVLSMCALHFRRDGTPRAYISTQASTATTYGTQYELISTYNIASQSVASVAHSYNRTDATTYPVLWGVEAGSTQMYSNNAVRIRSSDGTLLATTFSGAGTGLTGTASGLTSGLAISQLRIGEITDLNMKFTSTAAGTSTWGDGNSQANAPVAGQWFNTHTMRHNNGANFYGTQQSYLWGGGNPELYLRQINNAVYGGWVRVLNSGNYNTFSPSLTGAGASGTWNINITGTVTTAVNANNVAFTTNNVLVNTVPLLWGNIIGPTSGNAPVVITDSLKVQPSSGSIYANKFVVNGGTSAQYLMGDGSVTTGGTWDAGSSGYSLVSTAGYQKFSNGMILQWASLSSGSTTYTFPLAWPNVCLSIVLSTNRTNGGSLGTNHYGNLTKTQYYAVIDGTNGKMFSIGY